jgi:Fic family protein
MEKPPFNLNSKIVNLVGEIQFMLGTMQPQSLKKTPVKLRRENKIKTIQHSLAIEGNTLNITQVTDLVEGKRILGPKRQILEVQNAIQVYDALSKFKWNSEKDLLKAHKLLMLNLVGRPGKYRNESVGIFKGGAVVHLAPSAKQVPALMGKLFNFLKTQNEVHLIIKACVFHYELEFIHPFMDGNGRMGRLWQQVILMEFSEVFEFLSIETLIHERQRAYYSALEKSDKAGESTAFVEFSLEVIRDTLSSFTKEFKPGKLNANDRIELALEHFASKQFSRKEYLQFHKALSTAQASRDLKLAVDRKWIEPNGEKALTRYKKVTVK